MSPDLAHIVNPVLVARSSDLFVAQPITFASMRRARARAMGQVDVQLYTAHYAEDLPAAPTDFRPTELLTRSVLDVGTFRIPRKLPLLKDILQRLYAAAEASYLIYTNVDIGLQPDFYLAVQRFIKAGHDAFVINRRTLPASYASEEKLDAIYAQPGKPHRGWDCFVFPRAFWQHFVLGDVCVGASRSGLALLANLAAVAENFREFGDERLTFHLGDERSWLRAEYADYDAHNTKELLTILHELEREWGAFPRASIPGAFLWRKKTFGPIYELWSRNVYLPTGLSQLLNRLSGRGA